MCPVVLTRGADQMPMSTKFDMRGDEGVIRNYGRMLVDLAAAIPDGIVCFFVSYSYMDSIVSRWNDMGILKVPALLHIQHVYFWSNMLVKCHCIHYIVSCSYRVALKQYGHPQGPARFARVYASFHHLQCSCMR